MGSSQRSAEAVAGLDAITRRLRRECPWDREQDERSIVPHTVEEAYELADAARRGDDDKLLDELGDVLFQVQFLALLLEERGRGDLAAVADRCREKLIRRHPHVFSDDGGERRPSALGADDVLRNWDRIKVEVEGQGGGEPFADVPENLPALLYARKLQRRAENRIGVPRAASDPLEAAGRARSQIAELEALVASGGDSGPASAPEVREGVQRALGEALFALVEVARHLRCDPELALRAAAEQFREAHADGA